MIKFLFCAGFSALTMALYLCRNPGIFSGTLVFQEHYLNFHPRNIVPVCVNAI